MTIHANSAIGHNHILHNWEDADAAARDARVYVAGDVGKESKLADGTFWRVTSQTAGVATFVQVGGSATTTTEGALINGATAKTIPVDADMLGLMDSASSNILKKLSWLNVKATLKTYFDTLYASSSGGSETVTTMGALINSATAKTNPIDADYIGLMDSAASNVMKKLSWSNVKATAKTYFDTLYESLSNKDATGGYAGLTLFKINFKNAANTFTSFFTNTNTAARTYTFKDADGTIAFTSDITGTNSGTNTGDQTSIVGITGTIAQFNTAVTDADLAILGANTFTGAQIYSDQTNSRAMFIDCGIVTLDKGSIGSTSTVTFDYTAGSVQSFTCGGAFTLTLAFSNWPPTGNKGFIEVQTTNMGLGTLAFSGTVNWKQKNDTYTTTFGTYLTDRGGETALKSSGLDTFLFWSKDAGTTVYGVML